MYILAIKNNKISVDDQTRIASALIKLKNDGIDIIIDWDTTNLSLEYKNFDDTSLVKGLWGLKDIKARLRDTGKIPENAYNAVWFFYNSDRTDVAYWTYPTGICKDTAFSEFPMRTEWDSMEKAICHETLHQLHRIISFQGGQSLDSMDKYDGDLEVMGGANYQRNLKEIKRFTIKEPLYRIKISILKQIVSLLTQMLSLPFKTDKIADVCEAIKVYEGWTPQVSRSWRNLNPGNCRFVGQAYATDDGDGYAKFDTYQHGYDYLYTMIKNACTGKSKVYNPDMTLLKFFETYAPAADSNYPEKYAKFVADKVKVDVNSKIKNLL